MVRSISYPNVFLTEDGQAFDENGKPMHINYSHSLSVRGPTLYIRMNNRSYHISLARLLYEAFIIKRPLHRELYVEFKDGNERNCVVSNLTRYAKKPARKSKKINGEVKPESESFHNWNDSAIYC